MGINRNEYKLEMYREIREIIRGKIYLVINEINNKIYIKKILPKECYDVYKSLKEIENKNRAKIKDVFIIDERLYVIEEFINGENLGVIIENKKLNEEEILNIIEGICNGLEDLHKLSSPIIHRDIKPENIMVSNDKVVKLIDFDAGRIVRLDKEKDTRLLGTRGYASPEQFGFAETDSRTDIYSLGVLLNYLLTGKFPSEEIENGKFKNIIKKATEIDREKRYKTINDFKKDIKNIDKKFKVIEKLKREPKKEEHTEEEDWIKNLKFEKEEKKSKIKIIGFRSGNTRNKVIAGIWYFSLIFGMIQGITTRNMEDIVVAIYMIFIPIAIFGDTTYLNKIFKNLDIEKHNKKIRIAQYIAITLIIGMFMPSTN